jgi:hypothetical protein
MPHGQAMRAFNMSGTEMAGVLAEVCKCDTFEDIL